MKDEKKINKAEEVKEEKGVELTDEQMAEVTGGMVEIDGRLERVAVRTANLEVARADRMVVQAELAAEAAAN